MSPPPCFLALYWQYIMLGVSSSDMLAYSRCAPPSFSSDIGASRAISEYRFCALVNAACACFHRSFSKSTLPNMKAA